MAITDLDGKMRRINRPWLEGIGLISVDLEDDKQGWMARLLHDGAGYGWKRAASGACMELQPGAGTSVAFWLPAVPEPTLPSPKR